MPANLVWIQRPYIVCVEYSGEVSQEEILQTTADALEIVERRPTYFLIDAAEVLAYPKNLVNFFTVEKARFSSSSMLTPVRLRWSTVLLRFVWRSKSSCGTASTARLMIGKWRWRFCAKP